MKSFIALLLLLPLVWPSPQAAAQEDALSFQIGYSISRHINLQRDWQFLAGRFNNDATYSEVSREMNSQPLLHGLSLGFGGEEARWGFSMLLLTRHGSMIGEAIATGAESVYREYRMRQNAFTIGMHGGFERIKIGMRWELGTTGTHFRSSPDGDYERIGTAPFTATLVPYLSLQIPISGNFMLLLRPYMRPNWSLTPILSPIVESGELGINRYYRTGLFGINFLISIPF